MFSNSPMRFGKGQSRWSRQAKRAVPTWVAFKTKKLAKRLKWIHRYATRKLRWINKRVKKSTHPREDSPSTNHWKRIIAPRSFLGKLSCNNQASRTNSSRSSKRSTSSNNRARLGILQEAAGRLWVKCPKNQRRRLLCCRPSTILIRSLAIVSATYLRK